MSEGVVCDTCFRHCRIREGRAGFCGARVCRNGRIACANYGLLTAIALDPIEKKPLARFCPGSRILSVGSWGCNLACPFCQNYEISMRRKVPPRARRMLPRELAGLAESLKAEGNIGAAFTYNEPLIGWEYVRDAARELKKRGMKTVLVTNGCASGAVLREVLPYIDAMNIDLKGFTAEFYRDFAGGDFEMVKAFIAEAVKVCHVELTTLIIPGKNDSAGEMRREAAWIASLTGGADQDADTLDRRISNGMISDAGDSRGGIPLYVTRYFPRYHCDIPPTEIRKVHELAETAREYLKYVYVGNC